MINPDKVRSKLQNLQAYLEKLRILSDIPRQEFFEDFTKVESAKHLLQVSIETCLDIGNHIIASERFRAPETYADTFNVLVEHQVLTDEYLKTFRRMVQFRNRLVHLYWEVDTEIVYEILQNNLDDFDTFAKLILDYIIDSNT